MHACMYVHICSGSEVAAWVAMDAAVSKQAMAAARSSAASRGPVHSQATSSEQKEPGDAPHQGEFGSKTKSVAAWNYLQDKVGTSMRAAARAWNVDRNWLLRLSTVAAMQILTRQAEALWKLLRTIQDNTGKSLTPLAFLWHRAYDETPRVARTSAMQKSGELEKATETGKLMCGQFSFAIVFSAGDAHDECAQPASSRPCPAGSSGPSPADAAGSSGFSPADAAGSSGFSLADAAGGSGPSPADAAGSSSSRPSHADVHIIHGDWVSPIASLANQTAPLVAKYLKKFALPPDMCRKLCEGTFPVVHVLRSTDLHRSYPPAERSVANSDSTGGASAGGSRVRHRVFAGHTGPKSGTAAFRCSLHRLATGENLTLELDAAVESFLMNFTLALRHTDSIRVFRRNVERWATDRRVLSIRKTPLSAEAQQWRAAIRPLLFAGPDSTAKTRRMACWDLLCSGISGDVSHKGIVHRCTGIVCCPRGRASLEEKMLKPSGIPSLLNPPPPIWPRKSWSGRAECAGHCLQMELSGGLISRNFQVLVHMAMQRSALAAARLHASVQGGQNRGEDYEKVQHIAERAHKAHAHSRTSWQFLSEPDSLRRLIAMRVILEPFRIWKNSIQHRNGEIWSLQQLAQAMASRPRCYRVSEAAKATEARERSAEDSHTALFFISQLMYHIRGDAWCLARISGASNSDDLRRWVMAARAGAVLMFMMIHELSVYPWRFFFLMLTRGLEGVRDFAKDAQACPRRCFLDANSKLHWEQHPGVEDLQSAPSMAKVHAMAMLAMDNIGSVERGHAEDRRESAPREQTYTQEVAAISASHVVRRWRTANNTNSLAKEKNALGHARGVKRERIDPSHHSVKQEITQSKAEAKPNLTERKARRIDRFNAWVAANVGGRLASVNDLRKYHEAMQHPGEVEYYVSLADIMTRRRKRSLRQDKVKRKRKQNREFEWQLRKLRQNCRRAGQTWDPKAARAKLVQDKMTHFGTECAARLHALREARAKERQKWMPLRKALCEFSEKHMRLPHCLSRCAEDMAEWPFSSHGGVVTSRPAAPAPRIYCHRWRPSTLSPEALHKSLGHAMASASTTNQLQWEHMHTTLTAEGAPAARKETVSQRVQRNAVSLGRCLCSRDGQQLLAMTKRFSAVVFAFCGMRRGAGKKPKTPERTSVELGHIVAEICSLDETRWFQLSYQPFDAGAVGCLQELMPSTSNRSNIASTSADASSHGVSGDAPHASSDPHPIHLQTGGTPRRKGTIAPWIMAVDMLEELDPAVAWSLRFWRFDGQRALGWVVPVSEIVPLWQGAVDQQQVEEICLSADEEEDGERSGPEGDADENAGDAEVDDVEDDFADGDSVGDAAGADSLESMATGAKARVKRGVRLQCVASRKAGRHALTFLLTYKPIGKRKAKAQFQITCDQHEPEEFINKKGKPYSMPCRRTRTVEEPTQAAEKDALRHLMRWLRAGPLLSTRTEHQDIQDEEFDHSSSSSDSEGSIIEDLHAGSQEARRADLHTGSQEAKRGDLHAGSQEAKRGDLHAGSQGAKGDRSTYCRCWLCDGIHPEADCDIYKLLFCSNEPLQRSKKTRCILSAELEQMAYGWPRTWCRSRMCHMMAIVCSMPWAWSWNVCS